MKVFDPGLGMVLLLALALLGVGLLEIGHQGTLQALQRQARVNATAIVQVKALLTELHADEARYCVAARLAGDPRIIAVICPGAGAP